MPSWGGAKRAVNVVWQNPSNVGRRPQSVAQAVLAQARAKGLGRPTEVALGRYRFLAEPGRASFLAVYGNPFEYGPMTAWQKRLRPGDLFVDVGANVGAYSLWAHHCGASVIAVEADPTVVVRLTRNLDRNTITDIEIVASALSDEVGEISFTVGLDAVGHIQAEGSEDGQTQRVPATTLDMLLGTRTVAGMKIDVEGAERLVLAGAADALREHRIKAIQLEWNHQAAENWGSDRSDVADLLTGHGYTFWNVEGDGELSPLTGPPVAGERTPDVFVLAPGVGGTPGR